MINQQVLGWQYFERNCQIDMPSIRLVREATVVKKQYDHEKAYFLQGRDGRIVFAIPYEQDFTLIGTTDVDHDSVQPTSLYG